MRATERLVAGIIQAHTQAETLEAGGSRLELSRAENLCKSQPQLMTSSLPTVNAVCVAVSCLLWINELPGGISKQLRQYSVMFRKQWQKCQQHVVFSTGPAQSRTT